MNNKKNGNFEKRNNNDKKIKEKNYNSSDIREDDENEYIYGRNAVMEMLKSGKTINKLFVSQGEHEGSLSLIVAQAKAAGIPIAATAKEKLDMMSNGGNHQGVVASAAAVEYVDLDRLFEISDEKGEPPFFVICDGVEDPHNLGAIIRSAEGAGVHGIIIAKRRCCPVTATVAKASAGAIEHIAVARVSNIASAIDELKKRGVWIYGAEADGTNLYKADLKGSAAFVVGSEGSGISHIVREKCDFMLSIPMYGKVNSFNVSCAAAVIVCAAANARNSDK